MSTVAIVWLRRDFRLTDNAALNYAAARCDQVIPVYLHAPHEDAPWQPGAASRWWLHCSLNAMESALRQRGSGLVIRAGSSADILQELVRETHAELVCWNRLYEPAAASRDANVAQALSRLGCKTKSCRGALLQEPGEVLTNDGQPYRVYTPFSRRYFEDCLIDRPAPALPKLNSLPPDLKSVRVSELKLLPKISWYQSFEKHWCPGESGARELLEQFIESGQLSQYAHGRDLPSKSGVSRLSPHLHFGEITPRQIWHAAVAVEPAVSFPFKRQLVWRDFAHHILHEHPHTPELPFNPRFEKFPWSGDQELLSAWQQGQTGIPLVDAGMRQLWQTGWMHNRVRMAAATLLTKHALVHWREGARWFWDTLVDADLANNTMGWQWTAGCGVDAAPYFRILNPVRQGQRFDAGGEYVRTWVPELAQLSASHIHEPWSVPDQQLRAANVHLGKSYPNRIVDLADGRNRALRCFNSMRSEP